MDLSKNNQKYDGVRERGQHIRHIWYGTHCRETRFLGANYPMARTPPNPKVLQVLRICKEEGKRSSKMTWISRFECTDLSRPPQQAFVRQSLSLEQDLARSPQHRRPKCPFSFHSRFGCKKIPQEKGKKTFFIICTKSPDICTKSPDNIQQKCTCTDHKRAGTKVPSTSAHSLYVEWQNCFLTFAKHATSWKNKRTREKPQSGRYLSVKTWVHYGFKYVDDSGDHRQAHPRIWIIYPFCISEVIGCFVVQVWMTRLLARQRNVVKEYSVIWCENRLPRSQVKSS